MLLPVAFRSLPRPSSPDSSKASPANSSSLDHITPTLPLLTLDQTRYLDAGSRTFACTLTRRRQPSSLFPSLSEPATSSYGRCRRPDTVKDPKTENCQNQKKLEVWGFEPQTYGLQSHRSSHLSYTPVRKFAGANQEERRESRRRDRDVPSDTRRHASFVSNEAVAASWCRRPEGRCESR